MPTTEPTQPALKPTQRPYAPPALVVHGDVQTLTHKLGPNLDQDGGGSFIPPDTGGAAPAGQ